MDKTTRDFIIGAVFGYLIRHFCPPKEVSEVRWWAAGVIILLVVIVSIASSKKKDKKSD